MRILLLIFCVSFAAGATSHAAKVLPIKEVKVPFDPGPWKFFLGAIGEAGLPLEHFSSVYASNTVDGVVIKVTRPERLSGLRGIKVGSEAEALGLVRFFTDRRRFMLFQKPHRLEWKGEPTIEKTNGTFLISRKLLEAEPDKHGNYPLLAVQERVGSDGSYVLVSKEVKERIPRDQSGIPALE